MKQNRRTLNARNMTLRAVQNENSALTYTINWAAEFDTDTVSSSSWSSEDSGVTIANAATSTDNTQTSCRLSGDIGRYRVVNQVVTTDGDTIERYIDLRIRDNTSYWSGWSDYWAWQWKW